MKSNRTRPTSRIILAAALALCAAAVPGLGKAPTKTPAPAPATPAEGDGEQAVFDRLNRRFQASYYYALSLDASNQGRNAEAAAWLRKAAQADPLSSFLKSELSDLLLELGQSDDAVKALADAAAMDPSNLGYKLRLGAYYLDAQKVEQAVPLYAEVLKRDPGNVEASRVLAAVAMAKGSNQEAEGLLARALKAHPTAVELRLQLARCLIAMDKSPEAAKQYETVLKMEPDNMAAYQQLGLLREMQGDYDQAAEIYGQGLEQEGEEDNAALKSAQAHAYYRGGKYAKAKEAFAALKKDDPTSADAALYLGLACLQLADWDEAEGIFKGLSPAAGAGDPARLYGLSLAQIGLKRWNEAENNLLKLVSATPKSVPAYSQLAFIYDQTSRTAQVAPLLRKGLEINPDSSELRGLLSAAYSDANRPQLAEDTLRQGLEKDGENASLRFQLAVLLEKKGDWDGAEKELKEVLRLQPGHAEALNYLGYSWADRGIHLAQARKLIQKAVKLSPQNPYFLDSLGWVYFKQGDLKKAGKYLRQAAGFLGGNLNADDAVVYEHLGQVLKKSGKAKEAAIQFEKAKVLKAAEPGSGLPEPRPLSPSVQPKP